ncbi:MAG: glycosyltransferase, partial [Gaiellaceae bacterium]
MPIWISLCLLAASSAAALLWLGVLVDPARAWQLRPIVEDEPEPPDPDPWPSVRVIIPARDEESIVGQALPTVLAQDYPGDWAVLLVDERSTDSTATLARALASANTNRAPLSVLSGEALPPGWVGKVWGLEQGFREARVTRPDYYLFTDADILHEPTSIRRLTAESEQAQLALNSRMARLRCDSVAERLLIPAFVFFFNLLYPMRRVNDPGSPVAACAGGCVLVRA